MPFITQGKTNLKYLLIVVILAAIAGGGFWVWQYWAVKKQVTKLLEFPEIKKPEKTEVPGEDKLSQNQPGLWGWEIEELKGKGLKDPVKDLKSDLRNHPELLPYGGILGGTMGFYSEDMIWVLTKRWVLAYFEDGHIGGYMLLEYTVSDKGEISWKVIDSYLE